LSFFEKMWGKFHIEFKSRGILYPIREQMILFVRPSNLGLDYEDEGEWNESLKK
jgi:hypothetical protein